MDEKGSLMREVLDANTDFEDRLLNSAIEVGYDDEHDLLFVTIGDPQEAVTVELDKRLHFRVDPDSNKVVGITITAFKKGFLREHPDFRKHFETVFGGRGRIEVWDFMPQTEGSRKASRALRGLVPA